MSLIKYLLILRWDLQSTYNLVAQVQTLYANCWVNSSITICSTERCSRRARS